MTTNEIVNNFTYHAPKEGQPEIYEELREKAKYMAFFFRDNCPESRELSLAFTKLEEAVFWANASIARHGKQEKIKIILAKIEIYVYLPSKEYTGHADFRIGFQKGEPHEKVTVMDMKQIIKAKVKSVTYIKNQHFLALYQTKL